HVKTLSETAAKWPNVRLGIGTEFRRRPDGLDQLVTTYGLQIAPVPTVLDLTRLYRELEARNVDLISANSTDGLLSVLDVQVLEDDRAFFPPYEAGLVVRTDTLNRRPGLREALQQLDGKLSAAQMQRFNYLVDAEHQTTEKVADQFLRNAGLVSRAK